MILSIPTAALSGFSYFALFSGLVGAAPGPTTDAEIVSALVALGVGLLVYVALLPFTYGAVTYAACESAMGRPVTPGGIVRGMLRRYFPLLGYSLLMLVTLYASLILCVVPVVLWTWIAVGWIAVMPAMFIENIGLGQAMGRSWRLVEGRWWRTFLILFLMLVVFAVVRIALGAFVQLGEFLVSIVGSQALILGLASSGAVIVASLVNPVLQIAIVLIYFDVRVRREALDLFQLAQRVAAPQAAL